jgi:hypothetical protein
MSTKTLRKRIALVAVSALGAGLLSVVPVTTASAAAGDATNVTANATAGVAGLGSASVPATAATSAIGSVGLLAEDGESTTQTAVLLATGTLMTSFTPTAGQTATATITGGKFVAVDNADGTAANATISGTSGASASAGEVTKSLSLLSVPNSGATSMVITYSSTTGTVATVGARIAVTVVATSAYNKYAATYSSVRWGASGTYDATTDATSSNYVKERQGKVAAKIVLADAYGNALTSSNTGILQVTGTGGVVVYIGDATTAGDNSSAYTYLGAANAASGASIIVNVQQEDTDVPANGTLTVSFGGTVVATKSYTIKGEVAKITAGLAKIGSTQSGGSNAAAAYVKYEDAAGNQVLPASGTSQISSTLGAVVTSITPGTYSTSTSDAAGGQTPLTVVCAASGTQKAVQVQHLNASGTIVKSNAWDAGCAGAPVTMTASLDKASYKRGEVATLTLSVKDSKGNPGNAYDTIATADTDLTFAGTPGTIVTAVAAGAKLSYSTGAKTYQFTVTAEDGDYNLVITPTTVKTNNTSGAQGNITVPFSVTSAPGVTNADVLKAIVSLIASINKQIAALQKALLKR